MTTQVNNIVIVGGGTAGWLTAALLTARHSVSHSGNKTSGLSVTLIESPELASVGVGEGTWPTLRKTLKKIGISELDFLVNCDASFKQGSRFDGWVDGSKSDSYLHPFSPPVNGLASDLYHAWKSYAPDSSIADIVSAQSHVCAQNLAPKQKNAPEYAAALNYAYHLDAVKLANLLRIHATEKLGVQHIRDHVTDILGEKNSDIRAVRTREHGDINGDLFIDCTGHSSLLLGKHYGIEFIDKSSVLFNDRALVSQLAYPTGGESIASQTISTAHQAGWIWDIALPTRRGLGFVYSSRHMSDDQAENIFSQHLRSLSETVDSEAQQTRLLKFPSGYREKFWHQNCIAIGLSAGFLEPLEASAIVLVELAAEMLVENFPYERKLIDIHAKRFNHVFNYRWERIIDFLKLHYVLSKRNEGYWREHRAEETIPESLLHLLTVWAQQPPSEDDFMHQNEVFPAASYLYVMYGMGFESALNNSLKPLNIEDIIKRFEMVKQQTRTYTTVLPNNRALLKSLKADYTANLTSVGRCA